MQVKHYMVVGATSRDELMTKVDALCEKGFVSVGGVVIDDHQASGPSVQTLYRATTYNPFDAENEFVDVP